MQHADISSWETDRSTHIVSVACRYPAADDSADDGQGMTGFWHPLKHGSNLPSTVPVSRWDIDRYDTADCTAPDLYNHVDRNRNN